MDPLPPLLLEFLEHEKSHSANGPAIDDAFYKAPKEAANDSPGILIKVEEKVDTSKYMLPPATAMSRIMYQTQNCGGASIPASAFILWPYSPRSQQDGYAVAGWAHGSSGLIASGAPSNHTSLFQHWFGPYALALNGYVVVAPDYAGLGVAMTASGEPIVHEYLACISHANDLVYAIQAARQHFAQLSKDFVVIGHSQGGGAAWATAQRQVGRPVAGYLGAVALAPLTNMLEQPTSAFRELIGVAAAPGIQSVYPEFRPETILTEDTQRRLDIMQNTQGQLASFILLMQGTELMKKGWTENPHVQTYASLGSQGGKQIAGPLLVVHGEADDRLNVDSTTKAVERTIERFPESEIEYVIAPGVSHTAAIPATQRQWMDWIADRFAGRKINHGFQQTTKLSPSRPTAHYQGEQNWYMKPAAQFYHAP